MLVFQFSISVFMFDAQSGVGAGDHTLLSRVDAVEKENKELLKGIVFSVFDNVWFHETFFW